MECYACNKYVENIDQHIQEHDNASNWTDSPDHFTLLDLNEHLRRIPKDIIRIIKSYLTSGYLWYFDPCPKYYHEQIPITHPKRLRRTKSEWIENIQPYVLKIKTGSFSPRNYFLLKGDIINVPGIFSLTMYERPRFPTYINVCYRQNG